jgi:hypothetical protein
VCVCSLKETHYLLLLSHWHENGWGSGPTTDKDKERIDDGLLLLLLMLLLTSSDDENWWWCGSMIALLFLPPSSSPLLLQMMGVYVSGSIEGTPMV